MTEEEVFLSTVEDTKVQIVHHKIDTRKEKKKNRYLKFLGSGSIERWRTGGFLWLELCK